MPKSLCSLVFKVPTKQITVSKEETIIQIEGGGVDLKRYLEELNREKYFFFLEGAIFPMGNLDNFHKNLVHFLCTVCFGAVGPLAQLVERLTFNQHVEGSIPSGPTKPLPFS